MSIRRPLIVFTVFATIAILVTVMVWNTLARTVKGDTNTYAATFSDVLGLREGDDVRMAGVRVGKVERIGLDERNRAVVTFVVQRAQTLYGDTKALVRYQNLIGQRYVALAPGAGSPDARSVLRAGAAIPIERTEPSFDISGLLNGFQPLFAVLSPDQVNTLSGTLVQALQGDGVSLSAFITQAATLAGDFQRRDAVLTSVIGNLSAVMSGLARRGSELETLVTQTRALIGGLVDQGQALQASTARIADATTGLTAMFDGIQPKLVLAQHSTRDALTLLLAHGAQLDQSLPDTTAIMTDWGKAFQYGAYANGYLCSLDLSLYGVLLPRGTFSRIGGDSHSQVCRP
ncbi:MCE family protein [Nocardia sp. NPDC058058]|uniref:MCE family protein n=1 Tax=Nocardia sp. NPDC058058 TaxID=3346317 RepID=UPI0036DCB905